MRLGVGVGGRIRLSIVGWAGRGVVRGGARGVVIIPAACASEGGVGFGVVGLVLLLWGGLVLVVDG